MPKYRISSRCPDAPEDLKPFVTEQVEDYLEEAFFAHVVEYVNDIVHFPPDQHLKWAQERRKRYEVFYTIMQDRVSTDVPWQIQPFTNLEVNTKMHMSANDDDYTDHEIERIG